MIPHAALIIGARRRERQGLVEGIAVEIALQRRSRPLQQRCRRIRRILAGAEIDRYDGAVPLMQDETAKHRMPHRKLGHRTFPIFRLVACP